MKRVNNFPKTQLAREILHTYNTLSIQGHSQLKSAKQSSVTHRQTDQPITNLHG